MQSCSVCMTLTRTATWIRYFAFWTHHQMTMMIIYIKWQRGVCLCVCPLPVICTKICVCVCLSVCLFVRTFMQFPRRLYVCLSGCYEKWALQKLNDFLPIYKIWSENVPAWIVSWPQDSASLVSFDLVIMKRMVMITMIMMTIVVSLLKGTIEKLTRLMRYVSSFS